MFEKNLQVLLFFICLGSPISIMAGECVPDTSTDKKPLIDAVPGARTYSKDGAYTIYEGSLIRNLIDLARINGLKGVDSSLPFDIFLNRRFQTDRATMQSVFELIEQIYPVLTLSINRDVVRIDMLDKDVKAVMASNVKAAPLHSPLTCPTSDGHESKQRISFDIVESTLIENISNLEKASGLSIIWESYGMGSYTVLQPRTVIANSYYDVLAELLINTNVSATYE